MLNDMLSDIISVLIWNQIGCTHVKLLKYPGLIPRLTVLENSLDNPATVWVNGEQMNLTPESLNDEL
jgi:hypothetical protein